jgi:DNA-directed RNA polymerase subunit RPC12/RpoP
MPMRGQKFYKCKLCGKPIYQYQSQSNGYCEECKNFVLKMWNSVPFQDRVKYLAKRGVKF